MSILAILLADYLFSYDFCLADPQIMISEYAFKDSDITIRCDSTQAEIRFVSFMANKIRREVLYTFDINRGERVNTRSFKLLSDPKKLGSVRINLTNVQCSDAQDYACRTYSAVDMVPMISDFKYLKVLEMPGIPRLNDIILNLCEVGTTFRINCSNTVPTHAGSITFAWFYKDSQGNYQEITQNVTLDKPRTKPISSPGDLSRKCVEGESLTSHLNFTLQPDHDYGPNLVLRCSTSYTVSYPPTKSVKFKEVEVCPMRVSRTTRKLTDSGVSHTTRKLTDSGDRLTATIVPVSGHSWTTSGVERTGFGALTGNQIVAVVLSLFAIFALIMILFHFLIWKRYIRARKTQKEPEMPEEYEMEPVEQRGRYDYNDYNYSSEPSEYSDFSVRTRSRRSRRSTKSRSCRRQY